MVNNIFKSKGSVANCMTGRASVHTGNALEQFLHRNRTLILVHTGTGTTFETEQKPIRHSVNIALDLDSFFRPVLSNEIAIVLYWDN